MRFKTFTPFAATALIALAIPVALTAQENQNCKKEHTRYKLIELGTFGGPNSYFTAIDARSLNNSGMATGTADTPAAVNPPFCSVDCFVKHALLWRDGVMTDLGGLPRVNIAGSNPNDINAKGVVLGPAFNGGIRPIGIPFFDAVVWKDGQVIDLGTFGGPASYSSSINDRDQVAGFALNSTPDSFDLGDFCHTFPMPTQMRAFIWQDGVKEDLGTLGGTDSCAVQINEGGQAIGNSFTNSIVSPVTGLPTLHPFLWENGNMVDLGTLGGTFGVANAMNDRGQVVGDSNLAGDLTTHPFLWDSGALRDLGTFGGDNGRATQAMLPNGDERAILLIPCAEGTEGCEDAAHGRGAATGLSPAPVTRNRARLMPNGNASAWRTRLARRYNTLSVATPKE